jgi:hypothetical protein
MDEQKRIFMEDLTLLEVNKTLTCEYRGITLSIERNPLGSYLSGYVHIHVEKKTIDRLKVHGGITFITQTKIGFECCHPELDWTLIVHGKSYKTIGFVKNQLHGIVDQLVF